MTYDNKFANNTTNVVEPTQELWDNGIELRAEARSNVVNGVLQAISEKSLQTENTVATKVVEIDTKLNRYDNIFTFVVDSQENFEKWLNNVQDNGEDYTSVLVKAGTWTATKGLNLTTAGTKVVIGQPDSLLKFTLSDEDKGIYYDATPKSPEYRIDGLNIEVSRDKSNAYGFHSCTNLTNCTATATNYHYAYGFRECTNLTNCNAIATVTTNHAYGFRECTNLTNCNAIATATTTAYGFYNCKQGLLNHGTADSCYSTKQSSSSYAWADTPNGGFNDTSEWTP